MNEDGKETPLRHLRDFKLVEEDSLEAVEVISNMLYFMNDIVYGNIENAILLKIALLANKYTLGIALEGWKTLWLGTKAKNKKKRLSVCDLFSYKVIFNRTACKMVIARDGNEGMDTDVYFGRGVLGKANIKLQYDGFSKG